MAPRRGFTGGITICADFWNHSLVHLLTLAGATLFLCPDASAHGAVSGSFSNPDGWALVLAEAAHLHGTPVIAANRVGREPGLEF